MQREYRISSRGRALVALSQYYHFNPILLHNLHLSRSGWVASGAATLPQATPLGLGINNNGLPLGFPPCAPLLWAIKTGELLVYRRHLVQLLVRGFHSL